MRTGSFMLLERSKMSEILDEQGFQMTGCTSDECAVEAGKLLNVNQMCAGSVGKVGALYTVSVRLIDVQTGAVVKTVTEDCQCPVEQVLTTSMRNVAFKLAGKTPSVRITDDPSKGTGDIFIKSNPSDGEIYLDSFNTGEKTPATLRGVTIGNHEIMVIKDDKISSKSVKVKINDIVYEDLQLAKGSGSLRIYSDPPEAEVFLNGQLRGRTPLIIKDLNIGEQLIKFKKQGYADFEKRVDITFSKTANVDVKLPRLAQISFESTPSAASIVINGKVHGQTPKIINNIRSGEHNITLKKEGYVEYTKTINAVPDKILNVKGTLVQMGFLNITSQPPNVAVFTNGEIKGTTPIKIPVHPNKDIKLKLSKSNYANWEKSITLKEGQTESITAKLTHLAGILKLNGYPKGSTLTLNEKVYSLNKDEINLPVGNYDLKINKPGYNGKSFSIGIESGKTKTLNASLKQKTTGSALTRSLFIPGWGQMYQGKTNRSVVYGLIFIGGVTGSLVYTNNYNTAVSNYNDIRDEYLSAFTDTEINSLRQEMDTAYDDIGTKESMRNIFYMAAGAMWAINILDALILPPTWSKNVSVSARQDKNAVYAGISIDLR